MSLLFLKGNASHPSDDEWSSANCERQNNVLVPTESFRYGNKTSETKTSTKANDYINAMYFHISVVT